MQLSVVMNLWRAASLAPRMCICRIALAPLKLTLLSAVLSSTWSAPVVAQRPKPEPDPARVIGQTVEQQLLLEVQSRLQSKDLATIAWGGYLAAQHRVASAVPQLQVALHSLPDGEHRRYAAQSLLDALVVHGAKVDPDDLADFQKGMHEGAALALAAKDPAAHQAFLLRMHQATARGRFSRWVASGNLLAAVKDRDFARSLLQKLTYKLTVTVYEAGKPVSFGVGGAVGGKFRDGKFVTPLGFPPSVTYRVDTRAKAGDVLLAEGKRKVFYRREVHHERKVGYGSGELIQLRGRQQLRVDWLGAMLGTNLGKMPPESSEMVAWTTKEALVARVEKARASIAGPHDRLVDRAIKAGWFAEGERDDLAANVAVQFRDQRESKAPALPAIE